MDLAGNRKSTVRTESPIFQSVDVDEDARYPALTKPDTYSPWELPGHGSSKETCGRWAGSYCDNPHHSMKVYVRRYRQSCSQAECPICYEAWAAKEAHVMEHRLLTFRIPRGQPIHVVVSPSKKDVEHLSFDKLRARAYQLLVLVGVIGGCMIFHPFRFFEGKPFFSPHFHVLGYGWIQGTKENYERTGWVVKNLGIRKSVYSTALYQLSHAGVWMQREGKKTTATWFGKLSHNLFHCPREKHSETCPLCDCDLKRLPDSDIARIFGEGDPPPLEDGRRALVQQGTITREAWEVLIDVTRPGDHPKEFTFDGLPELTTWELERI